MTLALGATLALLTANAIISYRNILQLADDQRRVSHTHQVLTELEVTLSMLKDAESGQRGYLLTGNDRYLQPYQKAIDDINSRLDKLRQLTQENPRQQTKPIPKTLLPRC